MRQRTWDTEVRVLNDTEETLAYALKDPVIVFVSYFYVHVNDALRKTASQRASALLKAMLAFRRMTER